MKIKHTLLVVALLAFGNAELTFAQKTDREVEKSISSKSMKLARRQAKELKKEGWDVTPGSLPLEKLLEKAYIKAEVENEKGNKKYIFADGNGVGESKTAAETQALTIAKLALASQIESNVNALISSNVANEQLTAEDAASITKVLSSSKELVSAQLGYVEPIFKIYRTPKNNSKNVEVQMRIFYETEQSMQIAKRIVKEELKEKLKINEEQLDKMMGIK